MVYFSFLETFLFLHKKVTDFCMLTYVDILLKLVIIISQNFQIEFLGFHKYGIVLSVIIDFISFLYVLVFLVLLF